MHPSEMNSLYDIDCSFLQSCWEKSKDLLVLLSFLGQGRVNLVQVALPVS